MELLPTSKLRLLDCSGNEIENPREWFPALVEALVVPEEWDKVRINLQGQELSVCVTWLNGKKRILANWPRSGCGHFHLCYSGPGGKEERTVTVRPHKISPAAMDQLIADLEVNLPAAVAIGLQRCGALSGISLLSPSESTLASELNRLRRAIQGIANPKRAGLAELLCNLAARPHQTLITHKMWVRKEYARRPHSQGLRDMICRGLKTVASGERDSVLDGRVQLTVDLYENRMLRTFVEQVLLRMRYLRRAISNQNTTHLSEEVGALTTTLMLAVRQATFLDEVTLPKEMPTRGTMILLNHPSYRAAFQGFLEFHRSASIRLADPRLDAPLLNVPGLYQTWGTLMVISALLDVAADLGYRVHRHELFGKDAGGIHVRILPNGTPVLKLVHPKHGTIVTMIPERTYGKNGEIRSISFDQRPDIAVEVEAPSQPTKILLFDPKYKLDSEMLDTSEASGCPKKIDIDKMHSYRDAIRDLEGRRPVHYAAVLYPGPIKQFGDRIEAIKAYPGSTEPLTQRLREVFEEALAQS